MKNEVKNMNLKYSQAIKYLLKSQFTNNEQ